MSEPSASNAGSSRMLTVHLSSAFGTSHQPLSIMSIVNDQKPSTGGVWPLAKGMV